MRFAWFLNFWGWSRESHRAGMLLRHPLDGIGSNWDEWFQNEATAIERAEIDTAGRSDEAQREFLSWLERVWLPDAVRNGNRQASLFVRTELARVAPFHRWDSFGAHRPTLTESSVAAVVLADAGDGHAEDVRPVGAALLPIDPLAADRAIVAEGFRADASDLTTPRDAVLELLRGRAAWWLFVPWVATGRRPYPRIAHGVLCAGWLFVGWLIAWLWWGPDPGAHLRFVSAALVVLWATLVALALGVAGTQVLAARRAGRTGAAHLARDQVRLRLSGRFVLKGGSAGLPFSLALLQALGRAYPTSLDRSWIWRQFHRGLEAPERTWAASGVMTANGQVKPVELPAKLRACLRHGRISDFLAPAQPEAAPAMIRRTEQELAAPPHGPTGAPARLRVHRCRSLAHAVLTIARLPSAWQAAMNAVAVGLSSVMLCALPDLASILFPPPAPVVVPPSSPSPYFLWVSLETRRPDFFQVVLESTVWANRRADVSARRSLPASTRAEIPLLRLSDSPIRDLQQGIVWIERRPCFLTRRFQPGEVVGRYTLNYLNRLHHE
jgi:hypothetical protein